MEPKLFFKIKVGLIIAIILGYSIYILHKYLKKTKKEPFPIVVAKCPDYWEIVDDTKCKNVKKLGTCNIYDDLTIDFNDDIYKGSNGNYFKCQWAKNCGVSWQGIDLKC